MGINNKEHGCRQNFQQTGIISYQPGLGESLLKIFKTVGFSAGKI